jgi:hypothetical protein
MTSVVYRVINKAIGSRIVFSTLGTCHSMFFRSIASVLGNVWFITYHELNILRNSRVKRLGNSCANRDNNM